MFMKLRSFVMAAAAAICIPVLAVHGVDVAAAETQIIKSQPLGKEVAAALQQEQQAAQLAAQGRAEEAETLYKESLAVIEKGLPGDPILAGSLNNLAQFYRTRHRLPEAAELFNRALAIYVARYGDNHTLTATVINNLAGTYLSESRFDAAEPLYRRGLAASEKLLGPEHYGVAISLDWLAQTSFHQKRYAEAESQLKRGIAIAEKATGPDSQLVVRLLDHMISAVKAQGREQEAAALKERAQLIIAKSRK
jgi:tetratricopeptide (TPR) repeat protein